MTSELTTNGYSINQTFFDMFATKLQLPFYNITVKVQSQFGDITISLVEYTIVYFDVQAMNVNSGPNAKYLMDSGLAPYSNFGATAQPSTQSITLSPLPISANFEGDNIFYGISSIQCLGGPSIVLSAYPTIFTTQTGNPNFILNA